MIIIHSIQTETKLGELIKISISFKAHVYNKYIYVGRLIISELNRWIKVIEIMYSARMMHITPDMQYRKTNIKLKDYPSLASQSYRRWMFNLKKYESVMKINTKTNQV